MPAAQLSDQPSAPADAILPAWRRRLRDLLPLLLIVLVVSAAWWNAWPNALVHDDKFFGGSERFTALANIPRYFSESAWASSGISVNLYRPLLLVSITLDARAHGDWVAGYHLSNIALHALVSLLVFGFLRQLLRMAHGPSRAELAAALALALIFAVHPVHTEVVNSIFNRSEMLVALFGLAGLIWFLQRLHARPASAWTGLGLAYLLALFCKESAITLPGIAVALALIFVPGSAPSRLKKVLPAVWLLLPLAVYLVLRARALAPVELEGLALKAAGDARLHGLDALLDKMRVPDSQRLLLVAGLWYESFKVMIWPHPLSTAAIMISQFTGVAGLVLNLALVSLAGYQARRKHNGLILGLAFFYIALLPASRISGDPDWLPHLGERYLYFPSIGLAVAAAFGLHHLLGRSRALAFAGAGGVLAVLMVFTPLTWARNAVWASEIQLYESEYRHHGDRTQILSWLTAAYLADSRFESVAELCDRHPDALARMGTLSSHCAIAYGRMGRLKEAEAAYLSAAADPESRTTAHANLARFYLAQGRWREAKEQFTLSVDAESVPARRALARGRMLVELYPADREKLLEAKARFEEALALQPSFGDAREWLALVSRTLDELPASPP